MSSHSIALYTGFKDDEMEALLADLGASFRIAEADHGLDYSAEIWRFRRGSTTALWMHKVGNIPSEVYSELGTKLGCTWLHLLFQEKVVWEYVLYRGNEGLDRFVPAPEIWGKTTPMLGQPRLLSEIWGVKVSRIERYLRQWSPELMGRKAYWWRDRARYGDFAQGYDFLQALTGIRPK